MPLEHVLDKMLRMYIYIFNLKRCFQWVCEKIWIKTVDRLRIITFKI